MEDLEHAVDFERRLLFDAQTGRHLPPDSAAAAQRALGRVKAAAGYVWGSDYERTRYRSQIWAMNNFFGGAAWFVTLNLLDFSSVTVSQGWRSRCGAGSLRFPVTLHGVLTNQPVSLAPRNTQVLQATGQDVERFLTDPSATLPPAKERREAVSADPAATARAWDKLVNIFIDELIGYDKKFQRCRRASLFGRVSAYLGMVETQARLSLHVHFLLFCSDCPSLADIRAAVAANTELLAAAAEYLDSVSRGTLALDGQDLKCTACGSVDLGFTAAEEMEACRRPLRANETVPHHVSCNSCGEKLSAEELLREAALETLSQRAEAGVARADTCLQQYRACRDSFLARPGPPPTADAATVQAVQVLRALMTQYHDEK